MPVGRLLFVRLVKELSYCRSDLEYHKAEFKERKVTFVEDYEKFLEETEFQVSEEKVVNHVVDVFKPRQQAKPEEKKADLSEQNKEMFRKIAKKTHPDLHQDPDKTKMIQKASNAIEEGDWYALYELSEALGIEVDKHTPEHLEWLKAEIKKTMGIIKTITSTYEWIYSEPDANKQAVLTNYCKLTCNKK